MVHLRRTRTSNFVRRPGEGCLDNGQMITRSVTAMAVMQSTPTRPAMRAVQPTELTLSLDDIYRVAERERLTYSAKSRHQSVAAAHESVRNKLEGLNRSRPNTSASRYIHAVRRETMTPKSIRSEPAPSRVSSRQEGDLYIDELEKHFTINPASPSPICCEIMGPRTCRECSRYHIQTMNRARTDAQFRTLRISNENIAVASILKRYLPELSYEEIQDKVARGEIARHRVPNSSIDPDEEYEREREKKRQQPFFEARLKRQATNYEKSKKLSQMFFVNVRDLNFKINNGNASKSLGFTENKSDAARARMALQKWRVADPVTPSFVSPKNIVMMKEPVYKTFFAPPLLPKESQNPEPSFFAGSSDGYKLPDKLPDEIVFADNNARPASRAASVVSQVSDDVDLLDYEKNGKGSGTERKVDKTQENREEDGNNYHSDEDTQEHDNGTL
ncbi:uncharacterized protein LOC117327373 isoform X2 [Pecten maximus]|uniref:uncharacterized protein LOC117327373 isoform X2 n=1 Tax=Pecten maximus TaxID=6579 RepID=UPI001458A638|nr:uncharacterized protein LOC117327373 isoform X2 [Pecten maximus]